MITIIGMMIANIAIFMHTHLSSNGEVVYHAHPFNQSTETDLVKSHSHGEGDLTVLGNFDILFIIIFSALACVITLGHTIVFDLKSQRHAVSLIRIDRDRAPPMYE